MVDPSAIADAVAAALNDPARNWSLAFTAERANVPERCLEVDALTVFVCDRDETLSRVSKLRLGVEVEVDVGVFDRVANLATAVDARKALCAHIARYFIKAGKLAGRDAVVRKVERKTYLDDEHLRAKKLFASIIRLTIVEDE